MIKRLIKNKSAMVSLLITIVIYVLVMILVSAGNMWWSAGNTWQDRNPFFFPQRFPPMSGSVWWKIFLFFAAIVLAVTGTATLSAGCLSFGNGTGPAPGTLTGLVSIGPLCPVEPCSIPRERILAAYAAHPLIIFTSSGTEVTRITADPDTGYLVSLPPGTYMVDTIRQGIGGSGDLPATVTIRSGETVRHDISIDTGIR